MGDDKNARSGILDVARVAGVSPATVSRVINGTAKVSPATRQAVQAAIKTLHYEPNKFARSLITNRSGIIGVLIDRSIRYATANVLVQLEEYASLRGYMSVVLTVDKPFRERFMQALTKFRSLSAEGIIVIAPRIELSETIVDCNVPEPVIIVSSELSDIGIPMVGENQYDGACRAIWRNPVIERFGMWPVRRIGSMSGGVCRAGKIPYGSKNWGRSECFRRPVRRSRPTIS